MSYYSSSTSVCFFLRSSPFRIAKYFFIRATQLSNSCLNVSPTPCLLGDVVEFKMSLLVLVRWLTKMSLIMLLLQAALQQLLNI